MTAFYRFFGAADAAPMSSPMTLLRPHLDRGRARLLGERAPVSAGAASIVHAQSLPLRTARPLHRPGPSAGARSTAAIRADPAAGALAARNSARSSRPQLAPMFDKRFVRWARPAGCRSTASAFRPRSTRRSARGAPGRHGDGAARRGSSGCPAISARRELLRLAGLRATLRRRAGRPVAALSRARAISRPFKSRADRVEVLHRSFTRSISASRPPQLDRYVLLDAQDWMTGRASSRAVDRDHPHRPARRAGDLPHRGRDRACCRAGSPSDMLARWRYDEELMPRAHAARPLLDLRRLPPLQLLTAREHELTPPP